MAFKVGDKVKIVKKGRSDCSIRFFGQTGIINNVQRTCVDLDLPGWYGGVYFDEIELVNGTTGVSLASIKLPQGYTYSSTPPIVTSSTYPDWFNLPFGDGGDTTWENEITKSKPAGPKCECGQSVAANNELEDDGTFHQRYCPKFKEPQK